MYTRFYGFSEEPFNINPELKFLLLTKTHQQALDSMVEGINERRGAIAMLGELGFGKTILIQQLLKTIDKKIKVVTILHPQNSVEAILEDTLRRLGIPSISPNKVSMVRQLNDCLQSLTSDGTLREGPWDQTLVQMWPTSQNSRTWPPCYGLAGEFGLDALTERLSPTTR